MSHIRTQIRDRVATLLAGVATVYKSRVYPLAEGALPALLVYTNTESIDAETAAFETYERRIELVIDAVAQGTTDLDTALDDLIEGVEVALGADPTLSGTALMVMPTQFEISILKDGAQPIGRARLAYQVLTRTRSTDPTTAV